MSVKLTKRQLEILRELADAPLRMNDSYPPAANLYRLGLIAREHGKYGQAKFTITPAGLAALEGAQP